MSESTKSQPYFQGIELTRLHGKRLQVVFDEPDTSSEGGALLLREGELATGVIRRLAAAVVDRRSGKHVIHKMETLMGQRVNQICCGWEDANDCNSLRGDPVIKMATGRDPQSNSLGSQSTMTRLENSVRRTDLVRMGYALLDNFIDSYEGAPQAIMIDMDPSAHRTYGDQQLTLFNAHYDSYCLMPFYIFDGLTGKLITTVVRPGKTPTDHEIIALMKRIVKRIRACFPKTTLMFRADSHHTKPAVLEWLEEHDVYYTLGLAVNSVLTRETGVLRERTKHIHEETWRPCRRFHSFAYAARSWATQRRVIARIEATHTGTDVRYIVTNMEAGRASFIYEDIYCQRGNAELKIKEQKCFLKSDRSSCTRWESNQFRLFLHSAAYVIMHTVKSKLLKGTKLAEATFDTIRLKLLKAAARVEVGKTFIRVHMPASFAAQDTFRAVGLAAARLDTS